MEAEAAMSDQRRLNRQPTLARGVNPQIKVSQVINL